MKIGQTIALILVGMVLAGSAAVAATPQQPFLPFYWLSGTVAAPTGVAVDNKLVVFYTTDLAVRIETRTDSAGKYSLNPFELQYYQNIPVNLDGSAGYVLAVVRDTPNGYGTLETIVLSSEAGYMIKNLTLIEGGGPYLPTVPVDTVPLEISRSGNDVRISWEAANPDYADPQIFLLTGSGTGEYSNDVTRWTRISAGTAGFDFTNYAAGSVLYLDQVAGGVPEAYFRAIKAGVDVATPSGRATFEASYPYGKINVYVEGNGLLLAGVPVKDGKMSAIYPPQMPSGAELNIYPRVGRGLDKLIARSTGLTGTDVNVDPGLGFWLENPGTLPLVITFVGQLAVPLERGIAGLDLTGNPLPAGLSSALLGGTTADIIYPQIGRGLDKVNRGSAGWPALTLRLNQGFWYEYAAGSRQWQGDARIPEARITSD
ncbi:MAG: hypothetical protein WC529_05350 [Candidatus Margulisiibacteriota bacterium]